MVGAGGFGTKNGSKPPARVAHVYRARVVPGSDSRCTPLLHLLSLVDAPARAARKPPRAGKTTDAGAAGRDRSRGGAPGTLATRRAGRTDNRACGAAARDDSVNAITQVWAAGVSPEEPTHAVRHDVSRMRCRAAAGALAPFVLHSRAHRGTVTGTWILLHYTGCRRRIDSGVVNQRAASANNLPWRENAHTGKGQYAVRRGKAYERRRGGGEERRGKGLTDTKPCKQLSCEHAVPARLGRTQGLDVRGQTK